MTTYTGTSGNDSFPGTSAADTFNLQQGGNDTATGQAGNDQFNMGAAFTIADKIDGGAGSDTVSLDGDYSVGVTFVATTMVNVETIVLAAGNSYRLTIDDATVAAGATLRVDGSALAAGNNLTFNGTNERDGSLVLIGGAGDDALSGGDYLGNSPLTNTFDLRYGGDDRVTGGSDAKNFANFGATFTAADTVVGNSGLTGTMTIVLDGDYTGAHAVTANATTIINVDTLKVSAGHSYTLVSANANLALGHGQHTLIDGSALGAGDVLRFDGSATLGDGVFDFIGGAGNDVLFGSIGGEDGLGGTFDLSKGGNDRAVGNGSPDTFEFGAAFTAADRVDGAGFSDNLTFGDTVALDGNYAGIHAVTLGAKTMVNVERLSLAAGHSYTLATNDATVAAGKALRVDGSALGAGNVLTFDGGAETDGTFSITGGSANDALTGGAGADYFDLRQGGSDTVHGGAGDDFFDLGGKLNAADAINGGAGDDTVNLDGDYSGGVTLSSTTLRNVENLVLTAGHSYKITTADGTVSAGANLAIDASDLAAGDNLNLDGSAETNGSFDVIAGAGNDTIRGGAGADSVEFETNFNANDFFNGGAGDDDTLWIGKANVASIVLSNVKNIEGLLLTGDNYRIATTDGVVSAGHLLVVEDGFFNVPTDKTLWFDGSAETDGYFNISGGNADDHIRGGANADHIYGGGGADFLRGGRGADFLRGGSGDDTYFYGTVSDSTSKNYDTIYGFNANGNDLLVLTGDHAEGVDAKIAHGSLSNATFDSDLAAAVNAAHLLAQHAAIFTPDSGSHAGQTFLVIDANGHAGYQAGADYVIRLQNPANIGQLSASSFAPG